MKIRSLRFGSVSMTALGIAAAASTLSLEARAGLGDPSAFISADKVNTTVYRDPNDAKLYMFTQTGAQISTNSFDLWNLSAIATPSGLTMWPGLLSTRVRSDNVNSILVEGIYEYTMPKGGTQWTATQLNYPGTPASTPMVGANLGNTSTSTVVYASGTHVIEVPLPGGAWGTQDLNATMPLGGGVPVDAYQACSMGFCITAQPFAYTRCDNIPSIVYLGADKHVHEFLYTLFKLKDQWITDDLTQLAGAPNSDTQVLGAFVDGSVLSNPTARVLFQSSGHLMDLNHTTDNGWYVEDITQDAIGQGTTPVALAKYPAAWVRNDSSASIVYLGTDNHIHELTRQYGTSSHWKDQDLSTIGAPDADGAPAPLSRTNFTDSIIYHAASGHYIQLLRTGVGPWSPLDMSTHTTVH